MRIQNIRPLLHHISYFKYVIGEYRNPKISLEKSQYVYHILLIDKGKLDVCVGGKTERIAAGEAVYLLPGEVYRLLPCGEDFSLYNLSFNFNEVSDSSDIKNKSCVFLENYDARFCLRRLDFEDASVLNESGIYRNIDRSRLRELYLLNSSDTLYPFFCRSVLFSLLTEMLASERKNESNDSPAKRIIEYIRRNPEKDLSGESLSSLFSYHQNYINKLIKKETGKSVSDYVRYVKIEYARALLSEEMCSLSELAEMLGYYDYSHFYKAFIAELGVTPKEYLSARDKQ